MAVEEAHGFSRKSIPGFAKFIILAQTVLILYFSYWAVSEYNNNYYFQAYLNSQFQGGATSALILGTVGVFSLASLVLFVKLHKTRKELGEVITIEASGQTIAEHAKKHLGMLDDATEKHLIEMIRRRAGADISARGSDDNTVLGNALSGNPVPAASVAGSALPILKRMDESGREH